MLQLDIDDRLERFSEQFLAVQDTVEEEFTPSYVCPARGKIYDLTVIDPFFS